MTEISITARARIEAQGFVGGGDVLSHSLTTSISLKNTTGLSGWSFMLVATKRQPVVSI